MYISKSYKADKSFMKHPAHNYSMYIYKSAAGEGGSCNLQLLYILNRICIHFDANVSRHMHYAHAHYQYRT